MVGLDYTEIPFPAYLGQAKVVFKKLKIFDIKLRKFPDIFYI